MGNTMLHVDADVTAHIFPNANADYYAYNLGDTNSYAFADTNADGHTDAYAIAYFPADWCANARAVSFRERRLRERCRRRGRIGRAGRNGRLHTAALR